jgi:hypothetical protein
MACNYQGKIVTNGLVLCLDAADKKGYPGAGTVWTDRSGNGNHGTLVGDVGYNNSNSGGLVFDGINDRVSFVNGTTLISTNLTIETIISVPNPLFNQGGYYFGGIIGLCSDSWYYRECSVQIAHADIATNPSTFDAFVAFLQDRSPYLSSSISFGTFPFSLTPIHLSYTQFGNNATTYVNGNLVQASSITKYTRPIDINLEMGWVNNTPNYGFYRGNIFSTKIYNRELTAQEVKQNFNATRGRFGI